MSQNIQPSTSQTVSVTDWIVVFVLQMIPFVGLVMLFVWAFGSNAAPSKANFAKAALILILISMILAAVFVALFGSTATTVIYQKQ